MGFFRKLRDEWNESTKTGDEKTRYLAERLERDGDWGGAASYYERLGEFSRAADLYLRSQDLANAAECLREAGLIGKLKEVLLKIAETNHLGGGHQVLPLHPEEALKALRDSGELRDFLAAATELKTRGLHHTLQGMLVEIGEPRLAADLCFQCGVDPDHGHEDQAGMYLQLALERYVALGDRAKAIKTAKALIEAHDGPGADYWTAEAIRVAVKEGWFAELFALVTWRWGGKRPDLRVVADLVKKGIEGEDKSRWRPVLESLDGALHTLALAEPEVQGSYLWGELPELWRQAGEPARATTVELEYLAGHGWSEPHFSKRFRAALRRGDREGALAVAQLAAKVAESSWAFEPVAGWFWHLGEVREAAEACELHLRGLPPESIEEWQKQRARATWPQVVRLWELAGDRTRAAAIARAIGRPAKAARLEGRREYRIEEIEFPRGVNRSLAIGHALCDRVMKVQALLLEGRVDEARKVASRGLDVDNSGEGRLAQVLREAGLAREAAKAGADAERYHAEVETAIREAGGSISEACRLFGKYPGQEFAAMLQDQGRWAEILELVESGKIYPGWLGSLKARALYHTGRKAEAARTIEAGWRELAEEKGPCVGRYVDYADVLGTALLYAEGNDRENADRAFQEIEKSFRALGLWQWVLGMYYDVGRLQDVERVAREEDELECAIIAYQDAGDDEGVARISAEIGDQGTKDARSPGEGSSRAESDTVEPPRDAEHGSGTECACGQPLRPHWVKCPKCKKRVGRVCSCGEPLEAHWDECPACGTRVR